jgi:hypothetical protein
VIDCCVCIVRSAGDCRCVSGLSGQLHEPGMKCQVGRSPSPVALSGQLLVSSRRVPDGARGRIRCGRDGEFVFAAGVILVR